jgi:hypothetical protein
MNKATVKPTSFVTAEDGDKYNIVHSASGTVLLSFSKDKAELAEETKDWANKLAKSSATKINDALGKAEGTKAEAIKKILELTGKDKSNSTAGNFKPKPKGRDSYTSAARNAFKADNVTEKDKTILMAVESAVKEGKTPTFPLIAQKTGLSINAISGSASVMVAKGLITTERQRVDGEVRRVIEIVMDWRNLTPRAPKPKKEKPAKAEEAATAEEAVTA